LFRHFDHHAANSDVLDSVGPLNLSGQSTATVPQPARGRWIELTYDTSHRVTQAKDNGGRTVGYTFDASGRLTYKVGSTTLGNLTYTYNLAGNRTAVGGTWARTGLPTALASATYDAANQIATWGSTSFTYDDNGNLTNDGTKTYTWNARNQLTALSGGVSASFQYDGLGRRRAKTVSGASTGFLYDGLNTVQELVSGSPSANILPGLGIDEWLTRTDSAGARHFLTDALGSTLGLADGTGAVQTEYTYEPFGKTTVSGASSTNGLRFTGREDDGTGLLYYRARYVSPTLQRFASEDPLGPPGGLNVFAYASNAPTLFADPLGLKPSPWFPRGIPWPFRGPGNAPPGPGSGPGPAPGNGPSPKPEPDPEPPADKPECRATDDAWFRPSSHDYTVGRRGSKIVAPGKGIGRFIDDHVPAAHAFGASHDAFVGDMTARGYPDLLVNIPSMPFAYAAEVLNQAARSFGGDHWSNCH
jgi:RHS repeat-associated protein